MSTIHSYIKCKAHLSGGDNKYVIFRFFHQVDHQELLECYSRNEVPLKESGYFADILRRKKIYTLSHSGIYVGQEIFDLYQSGVAFIDLEKPSEVYVYGSKIPIPIMVYSAQSRESSLSQIRKVLSKLEECIHARGLTIDSSKFVARGGFGSVYVACTGSTENCNRIVKIGQVTSDEIQIHKIAANLGLAPIIYDDWSCKEFPKERFILMQRLDGTLQALEEPAPSDIEKIITLINTAEDNGIDHKDLHPGNLMYSTTKGTRRWYLIDYGLASYFPKGSLESTYGPSMKRKRFKPGTELVEFLTSLLDEDYPQALKDEIKSYALQSGFAEEGSNGEVFYTGG